MFNLGSVACILALVYLYVSYNALNGLMNPLNGLDEALLMKKSNIGPLWTETQSFSIYCFISQSPRLTRFSIDSLRQKNLLILDGIERSFNDENELEFHINILRDDNNNNVDSNDDNNKVNNEVNNDNTTSATTSDDPQYIKDYYAPNTMWDKFNSNRTGVYLHILSIKSDTMIPSNISEVTLIDGNILHGTVHLLKYDKIPRAFKHRYLLSDFGNDYINNYYYNHNDKDNEVYQYRSSLPSDSIISYFKPEVAVRLVQDQQRYPQEYIPPQMRTVRIGKKRGYSYAPILHVDEIGLTSDKYIPLNSSINSLPLKLNIGSMSSQRYLLMTHIEETLKGGGNDGGSGGFGFDQKDIDDVRRLISDTSVMLLGITMLASLLHLLFEFLAFRSDIQFWSKNKSLAGLSARSVLIELISQIIIFLYLIEQESSMLVIIPAFAGILIQEWKLRKATGLKLSMGTSFPFVCISMPRLYGTGTGSGNISSKIDDNKNDNNNDNNDDDDKLQHLAEITMEADAIAMKWILSLLLPLVLAYTTRTLIVDQHASWYSWFIGGLTSCVYTFGFAFMCPQLFINHRLKSVSHLPWSYFVYKAINTFIDDLFAFIIKMPTMHRLSVFRDDLVFLIYIYQRHIYKVDESRPVEK